MLQKRNKSEINKSGTSWTIEFIQPIMYESMFKKKKKSELE